MEDKDNVSTLYGALKKKGFSDIGTEEVFRNKLQDENNRKVLYQALSRRGFKDVGDYNTFNSRVLESYASVEDPVKPTNTYTVENPVGNKLSNPQRRERTKSQVDFLYGDVDKELNTAYEEYNAKENRFSQDNPFLSALSGLKDAKTGGVSAMPAFRNQKIANLSAAKKMMEDSRKMIDAAGEENSGTFVGGVARGFKDKFLDVDTWSMGITDGVYNSSIASAANKADAEADLTDDERKLLDAAAVNMATNAYFASDLGRGYKAGGVAAESLPFMLEMLTNPASAAGKGVGSSVLRYGLKRFGKEAMKSTGGKIARYGARAAGDLGGAMSMTATTGLMKTGADAIARNSGDVQFAEGEDGIEYVGREGGENVFSSIAKAVGARTIENYSEMFGYYFSPIGKAIGKTKVAKTLSATRVGKMIDAVKTSDVGKAVKSFEDRTHWNGTIDEYGEEIVGTAMNALVVGDNELSDLVDVDQQLDTFLGVSLMGGFISGAKTLGYRTPKYSARKKLEKANNTASALLGDAWGDIRQNVDESTGDARKDVLTGVLMSEQLSSDQKRAVMDYASRHTIYDGITKAENKNVEEGERTKIDGELENSYETGQAAVDIPAKRAAKLDYEIMSKKFDDERLEELNSVERPGQYIQEHEDEANVLIPFYNAKARYDGMIWQIRDDIDDKVKARIKVIEDNSHPDGNIYSANLKDEDNTPVYIVSGNIVLNEEGVIDKDKSGYRVIVSNNGKLEMHSLKDIAGISSVDNVEQMKTVMSETLRHQEATKVDDELNAPEEAALSINDELVLNVEGVSTTAIIQQQTPDGKFIVQFNTPVSVPGMGTGTVIEMTTEEIKSLQVHPEEIDAPEERVGLEIQEQEVPVQENVVEQPRLEFPRSEAGDIDFKQINDPEMYSSALKEEFGDEADNVINELVSQKQGELEKARKKADVIERRRAVKQLNAELENLNRVKDVILPEVKQSVMINQLYNENQQNKIPDGLNESEYFNWVSKDSEDINEIIAAYTNARETKNPYNNLQEWQRQLLGKKVKADSYYQFGDRNNTTRTIKTKWFGREGQSLDVLAKDLSQFGKEVTERDVVDFINDNPSNSISNTHGDVDRLGQRFSEVASNIAGTRIGKPDSPTGKMFVEKIKTSESLDQLKHQIGEARRAEEESLRSIAEQHEAEKIELQGDEVKNNERTLLVDDDSLSLQNANESTSNEDVLLADVVYPVDDIKEQEAQVNIQPTEAQKKAGNYQKGHVKIDGYDITIENPKNSERTGINNNGQPWSVTMNNTYGYIRGTKGVDGDHIDVFLSDSPEEGQVYVVDQIDENGEFDEHKVLYGFRSEEDAREAYLKNYSPEWNGLGNITGVSKELFDKWIRSSYRKTKPFSEYKGIEKNVSETEASVESQDVIIEKEELIESRYGAVNKLVTLDRYEELKKRMRDKLSQLNSGFDPEMLSIGAEMAAFHVEAGARKFADYSERMIMDLGDVIRPYLKSLYVAAQALPGMEDVRKEMDAYGDVMNYDVNNFGNNEAENLGSNKNEIPLKSNNNELIDFENESNTNTLGGDRLVEDGRESSQFSDRNGERESGGVIENDREQGSESLGMERVSDEERGERGGSNRVDDRLVEPVVYPGDSSGASAERRGDREHSGEIEKNSRNNVIPHGTDIAPRGDVAKIKANIAAIKLSKKLYEKGEVPTREQMSILQKYTGWGGLSSVFKEDNAYYNDLKSILNGDEYDAVRASTMTSFYTPPKIVTTVWDMIERLGFKGGNVLEPSAGVGHFFGFMPQEISSKSSLRGIELDQVSGMILKSLYPDAKIDISGFEEQRIANNSLDLVVSNVPFGAFKVHDKFDKDLSNKFDIHDYFIAKSVRKLKPGGIGVFISTTSTLDKSSDLRNWVINDGNADFIDAIRLNTDTFKSNAGTETSSDIIIIRKRDGNGKSSFAKNMQDVVVAREDTYLQELKAKFSWQELGFEKKTAQMRVNKYFQDHMENMCGVMKFGFEGGNELRPTEQRCAPVKDIVQDEAISRFVSSLPVDIYNHEMISERESHVSSDGTKEGGLTVIDGKPYVIQYGEAVAVDWNSNKVSGRTKEEALTDYLNLKNAVNNLLVAENTDSSNIEESRGLLNNMYDLFVGKYGSLSNNSKISFLRDDVDFPAISAIENVKDISNINSKKKEYEINKADIFSKRMVVKQRDFKAENVEDAINVSIYKNGRVDISFMSEILGKTEEDVANEMLSRKLGFINPVTGLIEGRDEYLSGNVREKLSLAEQSNDGGEFGNNVEELSKVIPNYLPIHLIKISLGSTWIPVEVYNKFFEDAFGVKASIQKTASDKFVGSFNGQGNNKDVQLGMTGVCGSKLALDAMNNTSTVIHTREWRDGKYVSVKDVVASTQATVKQAELNDMFEAWCKNNNPFSRQMEDIYNDTFNAIVRKNNNVSSFDYFPGATHLKKPREHQKVGVLRSLERATLLAHEVGTGKTITLISAAMEMRRLGIAKKPCIIVQRSTYDQFVKEIKDLYPAAKVLVPSAKDLSSAQRKQLFSKIAYNDWDIVVLYHGYLDAIPDDQGRVNQYIDDIIQEKMDILDEISQSSPDNAKRLIGNIKKDIENLEKKKISVKTEEKIKANAKARAEGLLDRRTDDIMTFEQLGIDALLVDEAHAYKKLGFATSLQGVKGIDTAASQRAQSLRLKTSYILENNGGKNVVFATGTPISNTMAEMWTFIRYLLPKSELERLQMKNFDAFVNNFGNIEESSEFSTNGKFRVTNRFARFSNIPELISMWYQVAHTVLTEEVSTLKEGVGTPRIESGKPIDVMLKQTGPLKGVMKSIKQKLEDFEKMSGMEKKENSHIPLVMFGLAKRAAIDVRLVDPDLPDDPRSKLNESVDYIVKDLDETKDYKGAVAIFCDSYQSRDKRFNVFEDIKQKLLDRGVSSGQIAIINDFKTDEKRGTLFEKVNNGDVRVIMGTTEKLGVGVNIQERLHALVHLDAPIRPSDYQQRNGRISRQGNLHLNMDKTINILRLGVEKTLDVTGYQRLEIKKKFIDQIMKGDVSQRSIEESDIESSDSNNFSQMMASLSGSQAALAYSIEQNKMRKLLNARDYHEQQQVFIANELKRNENIIKTTSSLVSGDKKERESIRNTFPDGRIVSVKIGNNQANGENAGELINRTIGKKVEFEVESLRKDASRDTVFMKTSILLNDKKFNINVDINRKYDVDSKKTKITKSVDYESIDLAQIRGNAGARVENVISEINRIISCDEIEQRIKKREIGLEKAIRDNQMYAPQLGQEFPRIAELDQLKDRVENLEEQMKLELAEIETQEALDNVDVINIKLEEEIFRDGEHLENYLVDNVKKERAAIVMAESLGVKVNFISGSNYNGRDGVKGFFNTRTGEVSVLIDNHVDLDDVKKTILHEIVGHKGLRALFVDDFDSFLDNVFNNVNSEIRKKITNLAKEKNISTRVATEEYLSRLAELGFSREEESAWMKIKNLFLEMLRQAGVTLGFRLSDNDLRYILWKSHEKLKEGRDVFGMAKDIVMREKLGVKEVYKKPDRMVKTVFVDENTAPSSREEALEVLSRMGQPFINKDSGLKIFVSNRDLRHSMMFRNKDQIKVVAKIDQMIMDAVKIGEEVPDADEMHTKRIHVMYVPVFVSGRIYSAKMLVKEYENKVSEISNIHLYNYQLRKTAFNASNLQSTSDISIHPSNAASEYKISDLIHETQTKHVNLLNIDELRFRDNGDRVFTNALDYYERSFKEKLFGLNMYKLQESYQDSMLGLLKMQEAIIKESGKSLQDFENAYMAENQLSSKGSYEMEYYKDNYFSPMMDAVSMLIKKGKSHRDILDYLVAKSGLERNEVFALRDAQRVMDDKVKSLDEELGENKITREKYNQMFSTFEAERDIDYKANRKRDYSGLKQLTDEEEFYEQVALGMVERFEQNNKKDTDTLWEKINIATKQTLKKSYESGLMTKTVYDKVKDMFLYYIPLRGWDDKTASDVYDYILTERSPFNVSIKGAKGRSSLADDPLAVIGNMAESAILQGNRNMMKQRFLNMVLNKPSKLYSVKSLWYEKKGTENEPVWEQSLPDLSEKMTPDEVSQVVEDHEERMKKLKEKGLANVWNRSLNIRYRITSKESQEHAVIVKSGGKEYVVYVNGNPRAAQAINGLTNPDASTHGGMILLRKINRQLAANFTTRNPAFVFSNLSRDVIFSMSAIAIKEDAVYSSRFKKNLWKNIKSIWGVMHDYQKGTLDMNNEQHKLFSEFLSNGGETGYTALHNVDEYKKLIDRGIVNAQGRVDVGRIFGFEAGKYTSSRAMPVVKGFQHLASGISFMNRCAEDVSRFSTYMTSRKMGRSIEKSISDAKEVTVNFNKKGAGGLGATTMKSLYLFFNAAMQSLNNFVRLAKKSPLKFSTCLGAYAAAGIILPVVNQLLLEMFGGDDDQDYYENLPEWVRRNNFCVWIGGDRFMTIPLPIELRAFYGMGEIFNQASKGNMRHKNIALELINQMIDLLPLNPVGGNGDILGNVIPDAGKPFYQNFANKDFFGKPVYKKSDYNEMMPEYTKAYTGTSKWLVKSTEFLNDLTGGDKYKRGHLNINPAKIEHVFEGYFGGMAKTINQLGKTISMIFDEDERMSRNIPVVNRFLSTTDEKNAFSRVNEEYYHYLDEFKETRQRVKGYEKEIDIGVIEYAEKEAFLNYAPEFKRYEIFKDYEKEIKELQDDIKDAVSSKEKRMLETILNLTKTELVDRLDVIDE